MKLLKRSLVLLGCALAAAAAFTACELGLGGDDDRLATNQDAVSKIEVTGQTTTFIKGADFSLGNGVVTATYVNGTTAVVTDKVVQSGFNSDTVSDDVTVTLSYTKDGRTVSTSYEVSIILPVKAIAVTEQPEKTTYNLYIQKIPMLDLTGLKVTATYEDDTTAPVPVDQLQVSAPTNQGSNELTITYAGKTTTLTVEVTKYYGFSSAEYYYTITGTGDGYEGETHKMNVGFARDAGAEYSILAVTLNDEFVVEESKTVNVGFINDPTECSVYTTTAGGDFTIYALADFESVNCSAVYGPWNIVIGDIDNPGNFGWVGRPDNYGFDPLPSYSTVTYTGQSNYYADDDPLNGHNYDGKYVVFKITGTTTVVKTEVYVLDK